MKSVTKNQLRKIWASAREIGLSEEMLRNLVERLTGQRSLSELSKEQAGQVIDYLEKRKPRRRIPGVESLPDNVLALPAPGHLAKIKEIQGELGWDDGKLEAWLVKYFRTRFRGLDYKRARGAFLALVDMKKRQRRPA